MTTHIIYAVVGYLVGVAVSCFVVAAIWRSDKTAVAKAWNRKFAHAMAVAIALAIGAAGMYLIITNGGGL